MAPSRSDAEDLDRADPLRDLRAGFVVDDPELVYLDGNSLGRLGRAARDAAEKAVDDWGDALIQGWDRWLTYPEEVGDRLAAAFLGAAPGQTVVGDSTTVNLYKLVAAAAADRPDRRELVVPADEFPTDRYVVEGVADQRGLTVRYGTEAGPDTAVLCRSAVDYRTAELVDVAAAQAEAAAAGAHVVWDLSHAAGAVPVDLDGWGVGLATGCTYKYLNGGPGAPAWLFVRRELQHLRSPIWGWFGQRDQFAMGPTYDPEPGIRRWLAGTPTVVALAVVDASVGELAAAGIDALRAKSTALTALAIDLADEHGIAVATPRDPTRRGGHVALVHPEARALTARLREDRHVVIDFREPDVLRFGLAPASTAFVDVWDGVAALGEELAS